MGIKPLWQLHVEDPQDGTTNSHRRALVAKSSFSPSERVLLFVFLDSRNGMERNTFTRVMYLSTDSKYLYLVEYFHLMQLYTSPLHLRDILYFLLHYIGLTASVTFQFTNLLPLPVNENHVKQFF